MSFDILIYRGVGCAEDFTQHPDQSCWFHCGVTDMSKTSKKGTALITGASTGIGAVYADRLARRGYDLVLVARNQAKLEQLAAKLSAETGAQVRTLAADLTVDSDVAKVEKVLREDHSINVLVNNAGSATLGPLVGADIARLGREIQL